MTILMEPYNLKMEIKMSKISKSGAGHQNETKGPHQLFVSVSHKPRGGDLDCCDVDGECVAPNDIKAKLPTPTV